MKIKFICAALVVPMIGGCGMMRLGNDGSIDYDKAVALPALKAPEGLYNIAARSDAFVIPGEGGVKLIPDGVDPRASLPKGTAMTMERNGELYWLLVGADRSTLWPHLENFWKVNNFPIRDKQPEKGDLLTDWINIGDESGERLQQYRMRAVEVGGKTRIFINIRTREKQGGRWQILPINQRIEIAALSKLQTYLQGV